MDKGLAVLKWVLIVWPKVPQMDPQMSQNLSAQFFCKKQKFWILMKKGFIWSPWSP